MTILIAGTKTSTVLQTDEVIEFSKTSGSGTITSVKNGDNGPTVVLNGAAQIIGSDNDVKAFNIECSSGILTFAVRKANVMDAADVIARLTKAAAISLNNPANQRVIDVFDSFGYRHTFSSGNDVWNRNPSGAGNRYMAGGEINFLRYMTYQSFQYDGTCNYGKIGQTSTEIAARLPQILDDDSAATVFSGSSINGFLSINPNIIADEQAAMRSMVKTCQDRNRYLFLRTPAAGGDLATAAAFPAPAQETGNVKMAAARCFIRRWMRETFKDTPGVTVVDMDPGYASPASGDGRAIDGMVATIPRIHAAPMGSYARALRIIAAGFLHRFPIRSGITAMTNTDNYDAVYNASGSRSSNPALDATGGTPGTGGTGNVASGWSGGNGGDTGHTRTYSKIPAAPNTGRPAQRIVLGGTMASNAEVSLLLRSLTGLTIGDRVQLAIEMDGWDGLQNVEAISAVINPNGATWDNGVADLHYIDAANAVRSQNLNPVGNMPAKIGPGLLLTPPFVLTSATPRIILAARALNGSVLAGTIDVLSMALLAAKD